ncbi:hypothetical protein TWF718_007375 [Orbilia javanica]|uniref:HNH nuclease domain-containing protein n=1 Tax=Orbilia javanica TaxID=47235 RepID=A0AAN8RIZ1_9PEZI
MNSTTPALRAAIWNIRIHALDRTDQVPSRADLIAGFSCGDDLTISTHTIFEDLKIIYPELGDCPNLTLWQELGSKSIAFIRAADEDGEFPWKAQSSPYWGLVSHDAGHPTCNSLTKDAGIDSHFKGILVLNDKIDQEKYLLANRRFTLLAGCAIRVNVVFDPEGNGYLPDGLKYYIRNARSRPASPSRPSPQPGPSSPSKRLKRTQENISRPSTPEEDVRQNQDKSSLDFFERMGVSTRNFEESVKQLNAECVITRTNSKFGGVLCGPGYVAAHIVPQRFWFTFPDMCSGDFQHENPFRMASLQNTTEHSLKKRANLTWASDNGLLLRSDVHDMFDRRLVSIHPVSPVAIFDLGFYYVDTAPQVSCKIRLFAPMSVVIGSHMQVANWAQGSPSKVALAHHYAQCVIENVAAHLITGSECSKVPENWRLKIEEVSKSILPARAQDLKGLNGCMDESASDWEQSSAWEYEQSGLYNI